MSDIAVADTVVEPTAAENATSPTTSPTMQQAPTVLSDLLVEDVSIDGMCGVY